MSESPVTLVIESYGRTHQLILKFLQRLSNEQLHWRPTPENHSIAFHAWHLGRWADYFQACVPGMTPELGRRLGLGAQIWDAEKLAERWGLNTVHLGYADTGMSMADDVAMRLTFPAKDELLDYVGRAFAVAERAVKTIDDQQFQSAEQPQPLTEGIWGQSTVGDAVMAHVTHENRHLGMMECLLGLQGQPGTATR
jgi:uncharacterized damage-inducible protein DinB